MSDRVDDGRLEEVRCARYRQIIEHRPDQPVDWLAEDDGTDDALSGLICADCWTSAERDFVEERAVAAKDHPSRRRQLTSRRCSAPLRPAGRVKRTPYFFSVLEGALDGAK